VKHQSFEWCVLNAFYTHYSQCICLNLYVFIACHYWNLGPVWDTSPNSRSSKSKLCLHKKFAKHSSSTKTVDPRARFIKMVNLLKGCSTNSDVVELGNLPTTTTGCTKILIRFDFFPSLSLLLPSDHALVLPSHCALAPLPYCSRRPRA
jgi:hypothetical protein